MKRLLPFQKLIPPPHTSFNYITTTGIQQTNFVPIDEITQLNFDYILITNYHILEQTYPLLMSKGIPRDRIVVLQYYLQKIRTHSFYSFSDENCLLKLVHILKPHSLIDMNSYFARGFRFNKNVYDKDLSLPTYLTIDAISNEMLLPIFNNNLYNHVYHSFDDIPTLKHYDLCLFTDYLTAQGALDAFDLVKDFSEHIVFHFRPDSDEFNKFIRFDFSAWGTLQILPFQPTFGVIISKHRSNDMKIYIVNHKEQFICPEVIKSFDIYEPIQVGNPHFNPNFTHDNTFDNIADLNPYLNELTALYWIWKNTDYEYVGLFHYSRYLIKDHQLMSKETIIDILKDYDIITRKVCYVESDGDIKGKGIGFGFDAFERSYNLIKKLMQERQPDYVKCLDYQMGNGSFYPCQLFITSKKVADEYCKWLFSFIIDVVKQFDFSGLEGNKRRIIGYWGESMLTIWLMNQNLKIKEIDWIRFNI